MSRRILAFALLPVLSWTPLFAQESAPPSAPAQAAPAANAETTRLRDMLAAFVTQTPFEQGILRIEAEAGGQRITLDPAPVLGQWAEGPITFAPLSILVREREDGNWDVSSQSPIDIAFSADVDGAPQSFVYRQDTARFEGVFSPELAAFVTAQGRTEGETNETREATGSSSGSIGSTTTSMSAAPGATGGADIQLQQTFENYAQTSSFTVPSAVEADATSFGFEVSAGAVESAATMLDARTAAIRDLYALGLSHVPELQADAQATLKGPFGIELKAALQALLPLWQSLEGSAAARDIAVVTAFGNVSLVEARQTMRFSGVDTDGALEIDTSFAGLAVESPMVPEWAVPLLPTEMGMGFAVSGLDLATPAAIALDALDFAQDPPLSEEDGERIVAAFDPERIQTVLKPGFIRADDYDIAFSGDFALTDGKPQAVFTVEATGIDAVIEQLRVGATSEPSLNETIGILQFAKGMARAGENGRSVWTILAAPDGSVSVNDLVVQGPTEAETAAPSPEAGDDAPAPQAEDDAPAPDADGGLLQKAPLDGAQKNGG